MKADTNSLSAKIGCIITELRKDKKITQQELAKILNVSKSTVAHYEQGINSPSLDVLIKLAKYFEVPVDYLLGICGSKIEYHRLTDNCTDNFTYGEIVNLLYSLPANVKNHICFFLNTIKKENFLSK